MECQPKLNEKSMYYVDYISSFEGTTNKNLHDTATHFLFLIVLH